MAESKRILKKKTSLAFDEDVYQILKLVSVYLNRDMTEIIEEAVVMWLIQNKEKLPNELKPKIDEIGKRFFPQNEINENKLKEAITTILALGGASTVIPYTEFLKILGILDNKEAKEAYEIFKVLLEKVNRLMKER
jgi:hypothetical protein